MNRLTTSALLMATAAAGFAAGWFDVRKTDAASAPAAPRATTATVTETVSAPVNAVAAPEFPQLTTVEDCRAFYHSAPQRFAGRHPFVLGAGRDYALRRWLELDAESALEEAERTPGHEYATEGFAVDLFRVWLDLHVGSAIEAWNQANPVLARNVRLAFLTALADKDPAKAFAVLQTPRGKSNSPWGDAAEEAIFRRWAQQDPHVAMDNASKSSGGAGQAVLDEWADTKPAEALDYVRSKNFLMGLQSSVLIPLLVRSDPGAVQKVLAEAGEWGVKSFSRKWTDRDPAGALQWAQSQPPDSPLVRSILGEVAGKIASSDPERALQVLNSLPAVNNTDLAPRRDFEIRGAHREAFASLAATNPERARELILTQPDLVKRGALDGYLTYAFGNDSAAAIAQCREWLANPALKEAATSAALMAFRWQHGAGARDPSEVIAALPELAEKVDGDVLSGWAKANPTSAAQFIAQRAAAGKPVENLKGEGVIAEIAIARPEWTASWLQRLPDPALQLETAHTLAANWGAFDPDAAARWINSLPDGPIRESALTGFGHHNAPVRGGSGEDE